MKVEVESEPMLPTKALKSNSLDAWEKSMRHLLITEMRSRKIGYSRLAILLRRCGINESSDRVNRKISRGTFSAAYFLACLAAMDVVSISIPSARGIMESLN